MVTSENFYLDNPDLRFIMEQMTDWSALLTMRGDVGGTGALFESVEEAREANIDMLGDPIGAIAAQRIAPRAEVDRLGCRLENGRVIFSGRCSATWTISERAALRSTVDPAYGGLGFSRSFYSAATEIVARRRQR